MTKRYIIQLAYNGTRYFGWQVQPDAVSIQSQIEHVLTVQLRQPISVVGAGRTDTGVHASFYIAHFDSGNEIPDLNQLCYKANCMLPFDIQFERIFETRDDFHARFDAVSRTYKYFISNKKQPFLDEFSTFMPFPLDIDRMNEAAKILFEYDDFTSFSKLHTDVKTNVCKIYKAEWSKVRDVNVFEISADRFLRNMVRAVVGTLVDIGRGRKEVDEIRRIIETKNRCNAGSSVPAKGLFLTDIQYSEPENSLFNRTPKTFL